MNKSHINGFIKRAMAHGLSRAESIQLLKEAGGFGSAVMDGVSGIGKAIVESGPGQWVKQTFGGGAPVGINRMLRGASENAQGHAYAASRLPQAQSHYDQLSRQVEQMRKTQVQSITNASEQEQLGQLMKRQQQAREILDKTYAMRANKPGMMQQAAQGLSEQFGNHLNWMVPGAGAAALGGGAMALSGGGNKQASASDIRILKHANFLSKLL
jgi:hypothetical protein